MRSSVTIPENEELTAEETEQAFEMNEVKPALGSSHTQSTQSVKLMENPEFGQLKTWQTSCEGTRRLGGGSGDP